MPGLTVAALLAAVAWVYLLTGHGGYWRTGPRLPTATGGQDPGPLPHVVAVIPARDEAAILPGTLPSLLAQQYPGEFSVVLVDDGSSDGTAAVATKIAAELAAAGQCPHRLRVIHGSPPPGGWAGKVWAMAQGVAAAGECDYLLFTDADIAFGETALSALVRAAVTDDGLLFRRWRCCAPTPAGSDGSFRRSCISSRSSIRSGGLGGPMPAPLPRRGAACWCAGACSSRLGDWSSSGMPGSTTSHWRGS